MQAFGRGTRRSERKDGLVFIDIGEIGSHTFGTGTRRRRRGFQDKGVQVEPVIWADNAPAILESGISMLKKLGELKGL